MKHIYLSDNAKFAPTEADRRRHTQLTVDAAGGKCQLCESRDADYYPCADEDRWTGHILCRACRVSVPPQRFRNTLHVPCISRLPTSELVAMAMRRNTSVDAVGHRFIGGPIDGQWNSVPAEHDIYQVPVTDPVDHPSAWEDERMPSKTIKTAIYKRKHRGSLDVFVCVNEEELK